MKQDILILSARLGHVESACTALEDHGISANIVRDEQTAFSSLLLHVPAFFWIDLELEAARAFLVELMDRFLHPPPYIILTAPFADSADRADMLDHGADACVEMPVDLREILSILNAVFRREERLRLLHRTNLLPCIEHKALFIDPLRRIVRMQGQLINLTPKEFDILYMLAGSPGVVFTKEQIYSHVWQAKDSLGISSVSDHISSLRQKLGLSHRDTEYIQTVFKRGYRFAEIK